jgi:predicted DNA-binding ArsR family transcriptional regulator
MILKHVSTAVLFTAVHLVKFLFTSMGDLKDYISRRFDSYESLQHEVVALHKAVDEVKKDKAEGNFNDQKVLDHMKIGMSVDLKANNKAFSAFMTEVMSGMVKSSLEDFTQTMSFVKENVGNLNAKPSNILKLRELGSIVKPGTIEGYTDIPDNTHSLISSEVLPGDIKLLLVVPVVNIPDEDAYVKAYQHSYAALVADSGSYKHVTSMTFMSKSELKSYLADLNKMMLACIEHKILFEQLMGSKMKLRYSFKAYLSQIFNYSNKLDVKTSLIELVYIKTIFAEKVYIKASMDMHDYAVRVLKANIKFAQANLKHLQ